jgi:CO/xanthine dehydrogenase Mo-binding subunit
MKKRGKGVALIYYPTGMAGGGDTTQAFVKIKPDGGADLFLGSCEIGQGIKTVACQILSDELGIPYDQIVLHNSSTDDTGICTGTFASRVTYFAGNAVRAAAADARQQLFEYAALELGVTPSELSLQDNKIVVANEPNKSMTIAEIAGKVNWTMGKLILGKGNFWKEPGRIIDAENGQIDVITTLAYGATLAEVEVDTETGQVEVLKLTNVFDTGKTINPLLAEGQIDGGVVMGIGSTLMENANPYYPTDNLKPKTLGDYIIPTTMDVPPMQSFIVEYPSANGPYGAKGIGEMTANTASPAIANAIYDAIGVWINDIPVTPEKILKALESQNMA